MFDAGVNNQGRITDTPADLKRSLLAFVDYFNRVYQTYGRKVQIVFYKAKTPLLAGAEGGYQEEANADALTVGQEIKAFADLHGAGAGLRRRPRPPGCHRIRHLPPVEVVVPGPRPLRLGQPARLHLDLRAEHRLRREAAGAEPGQVGRRPGDADEAPGHRARRARLALVPGVRQPRRGPLQGGGVQVRPAGELPAQLQPVVADRHQRRGPDEGGGRHHGDVHVRPAAARTSPRRRPTSRTTTPNGSWPGSAPPTPTSSASSTTRRSGPTPSGWGWSASSSPATRASRTGPTRPSAPTNRPSSATSCTTRSLWLFGCLQMAGPNLTPKTFEAGCFSLGARQGELGLWKFGPGDYTAVSDAREIYWDPEGTSAWNSRKGRYAATFGGQRFSGAWPQGEPPFPPPEVRASLRSSAPSSVWWGCSEPGPSWPGCSPGGCRRASSCSASSSAR